MSTYFGIVRGVDFLKWLKRSGLSQREAARRLGYSTNGPLSKVIKKQASIPSAAIPKWADALELKGKSREKFIKEAAEDAIPEWLTLELRTLRARADQAETKHHVLNIYLTPPGTEAELAKWISGLPAEAVRILLLRTLRANRKLGFHLDRTTDQGKKFANLLFTAWTPEVVTEALDAIETELTEASS